MKLYYLCTYLLTYTKILFKSQTNLKDEVHVGWSSANDAPCVSCWLSTSERRCLRENSV